MSTATVVRDRVDEAPSGAFLPASEFPGDRAAVDAALARLAKPGGPLVRAHKGLYWKGLDSRFGRGRPNPLEAALAVAGPGAGPAELSALHYLGLTTQIPAEPHIAVPGRVVSLRSVKASKRNNTRRVYLWTAEIALLESLRDPWFEHIEGGWESITLRVRNLICTGQIRPEKVADVGRAERSLRGRERLHTLLESVST